MELISQIPVFGGFISTMIAFIGMLGIVVFVHEYGHYIVGRWCGIHAEVFSLGFGPVFWSRTDKRGTKWQLAAIPFGGYVKFLGDRNAASAAAPEVMAAMDPNERNRSFPGAALYKRALTIVAGPMANFILGAVIFTGLVLWQGTLTEVPTVGKVLELPTGMVGLESGDVILEIEGQKVASFGEIVDQTQAMTTAGRMEILVLRNEEEVLVSTPYLFPPAVDSVVPLSAASDAGIESGDVILQADEQVLVSFGDLKRIVEAAEGTEIVLKIWRAGETFDIEIAPQMRELPDGDGGIEKRYLIGVNGSFAFQPATETPPIWRAGYIGIKRVGRVITVSLDSIKHIIIGNLSPKNLQGPIGIAQISKATASQGIVSFIAFIAGMSVSIGMLNLFPIPMLDGGHLMFYAIELVQRKPVGDKVVHVSILMGLGLVLMLMVFVTYNDIARIIGSLVS